MKTYWGVELQRHAFLTSALEGGEWSASHPGRFIPRETALSTIDYEVGWAPESVWTSYSGIDQSG